MNEGFQSNSDENKKKRNSFSNLKKAFFTGTIAVSSMLPAKSQDNNIIALNDKKPKMEKPTRESAGDAKSLEIGIEDQADTLEIKIANYYETDKADISPENSEKISQSIEKYLSSLNKENAEAFLKNDVVLSISCDPRHTNFKGPDGSAGNYQLARARANTAVGLTKGSASSFDFSKTDLTSEQIARVIEKFNNIKIEIPMTETETGQGEDGVVDYHDVVNPETNKNYTDEEWEDLHKPGNEDKKLKAYENFRYANLKLMIPNIKPEEFEAPSPEKTIDLDGYKEAYILFDNSPSMQANKDTLAKSLLDNKTDIPVYIDAFTSSINESYTASGVEEAAERLRAVKLVDDPIELGADNAITRLKKIENKTDKKLMVVCTDEDLQKVSKEKLEEMEKEATLKNVTVQFSIAVMKWNEKIGKTEKQIIKLSLADVKEKYQKIYEQEIKQKIENFQKQIDITSRYLKQNYEALGKANNQPDLKKIRKSIKEMEDDMVRFKKGLQEASTIDISNF